MTAKIEEKILSILNRISEKERRMNRTLERRTERVLIAVGYLKLTAKHLKTSI